MNALLLMACSAAKADKPSAAIDLYQGVMYETLRAHMPPPAFEPVVMIVSAEHGLLFSHEEIAPYDRELTEERADELIAAGFPDGVTFDGQVFNRVFLAGGAEYRRVMRAYVDAMHGFGQIEHGARIEEVSGGIGDHRHQLGNFLRLLDPAQAEQDRINNYANAAIKKEQVDRAEGRYP